jgi:hypothetical protein
LFDAVLVIEIVSLLDPLMLAPDYPIAPSFRPRPFAAAGRRCDPGPPTPRAPAPPYRADILLQNLRWHRPVCTVDDVELARKCLRLKALPEKIAAVYKLAPLLALAIAVAAVGLPALAPAQEAPAVPGGWPGFEQRLQAWRSLTPQQRFLIRARMTPDQRAQFQQQMADLRKRRAERDGADVPAPNAAHPRLSPEERRQLREQIRDAHREWNGGRPAPRGDR